MIQPTDWSPDCEPQVAGKNMSTDRAAIYRIIWDSAVACCLKVPMLQHYRYIYTDHNAATVAVAICNAPQGQEGFWQDRTDHPRLSWPANRDRPLPQGKLTVTRVYPYDTASPTPGEMIEGIHDQGISTPSSIARLFSALLGEDRPALIEFQHQDIRPTAFLTTLGRTRIAQWRNAGLIGMAITRSRAVERVSTREISHRDALAEIVHSNQPLQDLAEKVARQIDDICAQWRGDNQHDMALMRAATEQRIPERRALPAWIDPEQHLPQDHPLRVLRIAMEAELAVALPSWTMMGEAERAPVRLSWLREQRGVINDADAAALLEAALDERVGPFSALRYWLSGATNN